VVVEVIGHHDAPEELHALVAELLLDSQSYRRAVADRQIASVHSIRQDGLRMQRIQHVDAVNPTVIRVVLHESSRRAHARRFENCAQRDAGPLRNRRPALLARVPRDLRARWHALQFFQREGARPCHAAFHHQSPICKSIGE
jgi:hypothetical protein